MQKWCLFFIMFCFISHLVEAAPYPIQCPLLGTDDRLDDRSVLWRMSRVSTPCWSTEALSPEGKYELFITTNTLYLCASNFDWYVLYMYSTNQPLHSITSQYVEESFLFLTTSLTCDEAQIIAGWDVTVECGGSLPVDWCQQNYYEFDLTTDTEGLTGIGLGLEINF